VVLQNNGGNNTTVSANGSFSFATSIASGSTYAVTVLTQPTGQTCSITNGSGSSASANVTTSQSIALQATPAAITILAQRLQGWWQTPALCCRIMAATT